MNLFFKNLFIIYFKANAVFLQWIGTHPSGYIFLLFIMNYWHFGLKVLNINFSHIFCIVLVIYIVLNTIFIYVLVKNKPTRHF